MGLIALVAVAAAVFGLVWLIVGNTHLYRCDKCGFETYSAEEAAGHDKLENAHKTT